MQGNEQDSSDNKLSELYSELSQEKPSVALDEKILAKAHEAVAPKQAVSPFSGKWTVPASLAAVIVLSVIVVTMIERKEPAAVISLPEPAAIQKEVMPSRQDPGSAVTEETQAKLESQSTEPSFDSDRIARRSLATDEDLSAKRKPSSPAAATQEKKKARIALAKPAPLSKLTDEPNVVAKSVTTLQGMTKESESRLSRLAPEEDVEVASQVLRNRALESADDSRPPQGLGKNQVQSEEITQQAAADVAMEAAATAPRFAESAAISAPRAIVKQPGKKDTGAGCSGLSELDCLKSPDCMLHQIEKANSYQCRAADNSCETGFIQSIHQSLDCEMKSGCKYLPANCYCAPNKLCVCGGGSPAMCVPDQEDASR